MFATRRAVAAARCAGGGGGIPPRIRRPAYAEEGFRGWVATCAATLRTDLGFARPVRLDAAAIVAMRHAGRIAREVLDEGGRAVAVGKTTAEIDATVREAAFQRDAYPSSLRYRGFPASCCTSVNEVVAHGVPSERRLVEGDLINVDVAVFTSDGYHGDCSETYLVRDLARPRSECTSFSSSASRLAKAAHDALMAGVGAVRPGVAYAALGAIIEDVATAQGFTSVRDYCGHGVGRDFHSRPRVWHFRHERSWFPLLDEGRMLPGHAFTIEPMVSEGAAAVADAGDDGWTVVTADGKLSAQFEHTLLVTEDGCEVLTARLPTSPPLCWLDE